jgi:nitroimidazol reductase NimA-like FMN-containing flavoprotein (pyridoxamine 5'-phosphate oxidase superfamily)
LTCIKAAKPASAKSSAGFRNQGVFMDGTLKSKILELLNQHRLMIIATNRPDGWPQATTVGYVNDGLTIYFLCSPQSQKAANLARDNRI